MHHRAFVRLRVYGSNYYINIFGNVYDGITTVCRLIVSVQFVGVAFKSFDLIEIQLKYIIQIIYCYF